MNSRRAMRQQNVAANRVINRSICDNQQQKGAWIRSFLFICFRPVRPYRRRELFRRKFSF